jgi:hypothetical protein
MEDEWEWKPKSGAYGMTDLENWEEEDNISMTELDNLVENWLKDDEENDDQE